ncbi:glycosyltransferase family 2 protein [Liquorilactobacillus mali]|uniref:glycosyltransferase family 2 protein n=1 Tax=Liquorilactobacillus mali TaxID=1618 RepID=UPI002653F790|nr:glycosyltransferase family 2 protein [Liquorilactobacillus mali]MDN7145984.1 glycosyltransferase family 2 protein [Liquorilactobacillus mali]
MSDILIFDSFLIVFFLLLYFGGKKYLWMRRSLIVSCLVVSFVYLIWRTFFTLPHDCLIDIVLGIILLISEWSGFSQAIVFYILFWKKYKRPEQNVNDMDIIPTVDIFIATYDEDLTILKRSAVAAMNMDYPDKEKVNVYLCDDGSRPNVKELGDELGIKVITRVKHDHAKAGNLNHALGVTNGDLVVTMDSDMVPRKDFLMKVVGHFKDEKMGFIQTPQTFYNKDPYQFNLFVTNEFGSDQDFFMRTLEEQKDAFNSVMYVGSNAIFRRTALESIGGFTTGVITEDMATGMLLQAKGWKTGFVNKNLASGLAPETFQDLIKQRDRWGRGNIQVAKKWNPLFLKGLTSIQKLLYIDGISYWFFGIRKMVFLIAPLWYMLFGFSSLNATFSQLLLIWVPMFIATQLAFKLVGQGRQNVMLSNLYETATAPHMAYAILLELIGKKQNKFAVTRKGINTDKSKFNYRFGWPLVLITFLSVVSLIKVVYLMTQSADLNSVYINVFWIGYNLITLVLAIFLCIERPRLRKAERFESHKKGKLLLVSSKGESVELEASIIDWNESGARIHFISKKNLLLGNYQGKLMVDDQHLNVRVVWTASEVLAVKFFNVNSKQFAYLI